MKVRISIIEDHPGTLRTLADLINGWPELECVSRHLTADDALKVIPETQPALILTDLELPDMSGVECIRRLKDRLPQTPIMVYSIHDDADWLFPALQAGASGYLLKDGPPSELLGGLLAAARGEAPMSSQIARKVLRYFNNPDKDTQPRPSASPPSGTRMVASLSVLSPQERIVLECVAAGDTNQDIAAKFQISERTIAYRLEQVRIKLHAKTRAHAVAKYVRGEGNT